MRIIILSMVLLGLLACNHSPKQEASDAKLAEEPGLPIVSPEGSQFIIDFLSDKTKPVYAVTTLRNRYFTRKDESQVEEYFTKAKHPEYIKQLQFEASDELLIDTNAAHKNIIWVEDKDIYTCRSVLRDLWPCFKNKYGGSGFYYFGIPQFSKDGKYALISINLSSADKKKSSGGTRLFEKEKGSWREVAILTNWGADPE